MLAIWQSVRHACLLWLTQVVVVFMSVGFIVFVTMLHIVGKVPCCLSITLLDCPDTNVAGGCCVTEEYPGLLVPALPDPSPLRVMFGNAAARSLSWDGAKKGVEYPAVCGRPSAAQA